MRQGKMRIGIDFDNTLISYDAVFHTTAARLGLIPVATEQRKQAVRDAIRLAPDGELSWQKLQGQVYGSGIAEATMVEGVDAFLRRCRRTNCAVAIVSHKTEFGHHDPQRINLRDAALDWMTAQKFFADDGYGISAGNVFFESTRAEKLARIAALGCHWFIDDLAEVLADQAFPPGVRRVLFGHAQGASAPGFVCPTWREIEERIFGQ
jgi:hypothetical protein